MTRSMKITLLSLAVVILMTGLFPLVVASQSQTRAHTRANLDRPYKAVGLIRKVISESEDFLVSEESFMIQEQSGKMIPINGNFDFNPLIDKKVRLNGRLDFESNTIRVDAIEPLEKIKTPRPVQPQNFPVGQTDYDLATEEGKQEFATVAAAEAIILPPPTLGNRMTLIVPITFTNNQNLLFTQAELESRFYSGNPSVNGFFREASFNRFGIRGQVLVPINLSVTDADCSTNMFGSWLPLILAQIPPELAAQTNNYVFMPPNIPDCSPAISTLGTKGSNSADQYAWIQQLPIFANNLDIFISVGVHELGHQLGLQHAEGISLSGVICGGCDRGDFMGNRLRYPNAYHRLTLGWFNGKVTVVNGQGVHNMTLRSPGVIAGKAASRVVLIPLYNANGSPTGDMKFLEVRSDLNFYEFFGNEHPDYKTGLAVRDGPLDFSLVTSRPYLTHLHSTTPTSYNNAPLYVGEQFADTDGTTLEYRSFSMAGGGKARVTQTRGPQPGIALH